MVKTNNTFSSETAILYHQFKTIAGDAKLSEWLRAIKSEVSYETWAAIFNGRKKDTEFMFLVPNLRTLLIMMHELDLPYSTRQQILVDRGESTIAQMLKGE